MFRIRTERSSATSCPGLASHSISSVEVIQAAATISWTSGSTGTYVFRYRPWIVLRRPSTPSTSPASTADPAQDRVLKNDYITTW